VFNDGVNVVAATNLTGISGTLPVTNGGTGATTLTGVLKGNGTSAFTASDVNLASEVTGTLPIANGGTGSTSTTFVNLASNVTGTLPVARGGTGQTTYTNGQLLIGNSTGNTLTKATLTAGTGISITNGTGSITVASTNNGTVTSVGGTGTINGVTLTGNVTSSGNLTLGGAINVSNISVGTLATARGGTGQNSYTNGQLLIGSTPTGSLAKTTLTAGTGITITNGAGSITVAASGGGITSNVKAYNSPATLAIPPGSNKAFVYVASGGGGTGGGVPNGQNGGTGGNGIMGGGFYPVSGGSNVSITVGGGGNKGNAGTPNLVGGAGGAGGASSFGSSLTANGGSGGNGANYGANGNPGTNGNAPLAQVTSIWPGSQYATFGNFEVSRPGPGNAQPGRAGRVVVWV
jgi:hypothetical protein